MLQVPLRQRQVIEPTDSESEDIEHIGERQEAMQAAPANSAHSTPAENVNNNAFSGRGLQRQQSVSVPSAFNGVPPGVILVVLSSSKNTNASTHMRPRNTRVKRKNQSGLAVMAEATKTIGVILAFQMKDIADSNLAHEKVKVEV